VELEVKKFRLQIKTAVGDYKIISTPQIFLNKNKMLEQDTAIISLEKYYPVVGSRSTVRGEAALVIDSISPDISEILEYDIIEDDNYIEVISDGKIIMRVEK